MHVWSVECGVVAVSGPIRVHGRGHKPAMESRREGLMSSDITPKNVSVVLSVCSCTMPKVVAVTAAAAAAATTENHEMHNEPF